MKKFTLLVALLCIAALFVCGCATQNATSTDATGDVAGDPNGAEGPKDYTGTFRVGYGRVNITPDLGLGLAGMGDDATRLATAVDAPLYMTCIAVTDENENTLLLMTADNVRTETWFCDEMRDTISKELNVPRVNIFHTTTHTHNAPSTADPKYIKFYQESSLEACRLAMEDRLPAEMYSGTTKSEGLNFVRHYLMSDGTYFGDGGYGDNTGKTYVAHETEVDNEVQLIRFTRTAGKDIVMMNWRAHPILTSGTLYYSISAGYVGHCRREMEKKLDCHFAYFQGASGNVSDVSYIREEHNFRSHIDQGKQLAQLAIDAMPTLKKVESGAVEVRTVTYKGNVRVDSQEYTDAAKTFNSVLARGGTVAQAIAATDGLCRSQNALTNINMRKQAYEDGNGKYNIEIAAISIGDVAFISSPHEMFDNTGAQIKEGSPYAQTFILAYSNGRAMYLPSEPAYTNGCYEKERSYYVKGTAEEQAALYIDMLKEVHADGVVDPTIGTFDSKLPNDQ